MSSRQLDSEFDSNQGEKSCDDGNAVGASSQEDRKPGDVTAKSTGNQTSPASVVDRENSKGVPSREPAIWTEGGSSSNSAVRTLPATQTAPMNGPGRDDLGDGAQSGNIKARNVPTNAMAARTSSVPEDTLILGSTPSARSSPVQVLGFAVEVVDSSKANVALVAEWPGIGSLHDLLSGKINLARGACQEDLVRWTRQLAEGLVHVSHGDLGGSGSEASLNVCTRNAFLFLRPRDEFQEGPDTVDVRVRLAVETAILVHEWLP